MLKIIIAIALTAVCAEDHHGHSHAYSSQSFHIANGHESSGHGHQGVSHGHLEVSVGHQELSQGHPGLKIGHYELSLGQHEISQGHHGLSLGHHEVSQGHHESSHGHQELSQAHHALSHSHQQLSHGQKEISFSHNELSLGHHGGKQPILFQLAHPAPIAHHEVPAIILHHKAPAASLHHAELAHQEAHGHATQTGKEHDSEGHLIDYHAHPKYEYEYKIEDPHTGDNKFQHETRDGDAVKGIYSLHDSDGSIRTVEYTSDKHKGFNAVIKTQTKHGHTYIQH